MMEREEKEGRHFGEKQIRIGDFPSERSAKAASGRTYVHTSSKQTNSSLSLCGSSGGIEEKDLVAGVDLKPK